MATARIQLITTTDADQVQRPRPWSVVASEQKHRTPRRSSRSSNAFRKQLHIVVVPDNPKLVRSAASKYVLVVDSRAENSVKFQALVEEWQKERGSRSSITEAAMMPAYQQIIGMGDAAVPLLLHQLYCEGNEPDQWFWALKVITGANPVKPENRGNFRKMAHDWLEWGKENVYVHVR